MQPCWYVSQDSEGTELNIYFRWYLLDWLTQYGLSHSTVALSTLERLDVSAFLIWHRSLEASWGTSHHSRRLKSANHVSISDSHSVDTLPNKELRQASQSITHFPQISWYAGLCQKALPHSQTYPELCLLVEDGSNQVDIAGDPSQLQGCEGK